MNCDVFSILFEKRHASGLVRLKINLVSPYNVILAYENSISNLRIILLFLFYLIIFLLSRFFFPCSLMTRFCNLSHSLFHLSQSTENPQFLSLIFFQWPPELIKNPKEFHYNTKLTIDKCLIQAR